MPTPRSPVLVVQPMQRKEIMKVKSPNLEGISNNIKPPVLSGPPHHLIENIVENIELLFSLTDMGNTDCTGSYFVDHNIKSSMFGL